MRSCSADLRQSLLLRRIVSLRQCIHRFTFCGVCSAADAAYIRDPEVALQR